MKLSQAIDGFVFALKADGYSLSTVDLYRIMLAVLTSFLDDCDVDEITSSDLTRYFAYLRTDYKPQRQGSNVEPLSGSTLQNHWKANRRFFRWAQDEIGLKERPDVRLKLPSNNPRTILPLSEADIRALLDAAEYTREAQASGRRNFRMKRSTGDRDSAFIILLLDTGLRCGEACRLNIKDVDLENGEVFIAPFGNSRRKTKSRVVPVGKAARRILWRYLTTRQDAAKDDPLFSTITGRRLNNNSARLLLKSLGEKAGVSNCHPHRLRHTFAVEYLRNGGDIFTLQMILGHSSLDMVRVYLQLVKADAKNAHRRSSPADKWRL
jgi:integrase/recombinase XerD